MKTKIKADVDYKKEIINLLKEAAYSKSIAQVFNDFLEMSAISISNTVDFTHREKREKRYLEIIHSYEKRHQELFPEMFANLVMSLDEKAQTVGTEDVLGVIFHELELHDEYKGQFFTPQHISDFMAEVTCGEDTQEAIKEQGFITVLEPACGSGVMITSFLKSMQKADLNYQSQAVIMAVDIDLKCVHMTYLQLSLYGVPAVVIHGNSLTCEEFSRWYTPIYILKGWIWRQKCSLTNRFCVEDEMLKRGLEPTYNALRQIEAIMIDEAPTENIKSAENIVSPELDLIADKDGQIQFDNDFEAPEADKKVKPAVKILRPKSQDYSEQMSLFED